MMIGRVSHVFMVLLLSMVVMDGCKKVPVSAVEGGAELSAEVTGNKGLEGLWVDSEEGFAIQVVAHGRSFGVQKVIDKGYGGGTMDTIDSTWKDGQLRWSFYVEEVGVAECRTVEVNSDSLIYECTVRGDRLVGTMTRGGSGGSGHWGNSAGIPVGQWVDGETQVVFFFNHVEGTTRLVAILDESDGEYFLPLVDEYDGMTYRWSYYVPSTQTTVDCVSETISGDNVFYTWKNSDEVEGTDNLWLRDEDPNYYQAAGDPWGYDEEWYEDEWLEEGYGIPDLPEEAYEPISSIEDIAGRWRDGDSSVVMTFEVIDGAPQLISIIDEIGEITFDVLSTSWNGEVLGWRYFVPESGLTLVNQSTSVTVGAIEYEWNNGDVDGTDMLIKLDMEWMDGGGDATDEAMNQGILGVLLEDNTAVLDGELSLEDFEGVFGEGGLGGGFGTAQEESEEGTGE